MKKYEKPMIIIEEFNLSQHVADCALDFADASGEKTLSDANSCVAYTDADFWGSVFPVFTDANVNCTDKYEEYCYTTGSDGIKTFIS